jgi:hypothetical protein
MTSFGADHLPAYVCSHVFSAERPILLVSHEGGDWQFLCGSTHPGEQPIVVGIAHLVQRDPSLEDVADLAVDEDAERDSPGSSWVRRA